MLMALSAAPAQADPLANVDPGATAVLNIHKSKQPNELGKESTGVDQGAAVDPLSNITFTAKRVDGIDLTKNDGWDEARKMTVESARAAPGTSSTAVTNAAGLAKFADRRPRCSKLARLKTWRPSTQTCQAST